MSANPSRRRLVHAAPALSFLLLLLGPLLVACTGGGGANGATSPAPDPSGAANACAPGGSSGSASYPGWPGGGAPVGGADLIPEVVSTELTVGPDRFLMTIIDSKNNLVAASNVGVDLRFFELARDPASPVAAATATFMDSGNGLGLYRASVTFPCSGDWGAEVVTHRASGDTTSRVAFPVQAQSTTPAIGAPAPHADTPTATSATGIAAISTDPNPDPDFYRMTITQAVTAGKPALIIFATPAFCRTAVCGPTLGIVKSVAAGFKGPVNFVHVEPYLMEQGTGGLQPILDEGGNLQPVQSVDTYGLQTEPYTFVVDAQGRIAAKFEAMVGRDELTAALDAVTGRAASPAPGGPGVPAGSPAPGGSPSTAASIAPSPGVSPVP